MLLTDWEKTGGETDLVKIKIKKIIVITITANNNKDG